MRLKRGGEAPFLDKLMQSEWNPIGINITCHRFSERIGFERVNLNLKTSPERPFKGKALLES
eukprot:6308738-Amphidinium_carterae.1